ncbi:MAG: hypothetical protein HZB15_14460 [Actinobacteria bacterium]|nr:hypothetical protein [Actinomycetota bacterium]
MTGWARNMVIGAVLAAAGVAACGGDDDTSEGSSGSARSVTALLDELPSSLATGDDLVQIAYGDLDAATEASGVERPARTAGADETITWAQAISSPSTPDDGSPAIAAIFPEAVSPTMLAQIEEFRDEVGWSLLDVGAFIEFQQPPQVFTVIGGEIDATEIDDAVGAAQDDIWTVGEGDDFQTDLASRTAARPLGTPLRMAEHDGLLAVSRSTPPVQAWLGDEPSLADDPALGELAEQLDDARVYSAYLLDVDGSTDTNPFDAVALGVATDDDQPIGLFVYHYADAAAAEQAVDAVTALFDGRSDLTQAPWTETFSSVDVAAHDDAVVARVTFADDRPPAVMWQIAFARDNLTA